MTHPGVGPITALAFVPIVGSPDRFGCGKRIGSYLGLIPEEDSSANRQRLGHITKQGSSLLRYLLAESAQAAVRWDPDWRRRLQRLSRAFVGDLLSPVDFPTKLRLGLPILHFPL